jgi:hypothetical protein
MTAMYAQLEEQPAGPVYRAPRAITTLLVARLLRQGCGATPCRVRNVSASGMLVETRAALTRGMPVSLELRGGTCIEGTVVWHENGCAGIAASAPIDLDGFLSETGNKLGVPRAPRFDIACPVRLSSYGSTTAGTVENLSQTGARLALATPISAGVTYRIVFPGLPPRDCEVRWCGGDEVGVRFVEPLAFNELDRWLSNSAAA